MDVHDIGFVPLLSVNKVRLTGLNRVLKLITDYALDYPRTDPNLAIDADDSHLS